MARYQKGHKGEQKVYYPYTVKLQADNPRDMKAHEELAKWKLQGNGQTGFLRENVVNAILLYIGDSSYQEALASARNQQGRLNIALQHALEKSMPLLMRSLINGIVDGVLAQLQITGQLGVVHPEQRQALVEQANINYDRDMQRFLESQSQSGQNLFDSIQVEED